MAKRKDSKGRNLKAGETQRKDGRYCFRYTDAAGKSRSIYAHDLPELREKEKAALKDKEEGIATDNKLTLNELFDKYMQTKDLKESTAYNYRRLWDLHVRDGLGLRKAAEIRASDIKVFCAGMNRYSNSTVKLVMGLIKPSFELAVEDNIIRSNPANHVSLGAYGKSRKKRNALSISQQESLLDFVCESGTYAKYYPMLIIMIGTAMRAGELIALTWNDVDFKKREILVDKQLIYKNYGDGYKFHNASPKTEAGVRTIPMTQELHDAFLKQRELDLLKGVPHEENGGFVFGLANGRPMMPSSLNNILYNIVDAYNRREDEKAKEETKPHTPEYMPKFSAHVLRHTGCTRMAEAGMRLKVISYILGHADVDVTLSVYEHVTDQATVLSELEKIKVSKPSETKESASNCVKFVSNDV